VKLEPDKSKKTKDVFNTAYFTEKEIRPGEALKPMILNATNSKMLKDITGSPFIDDWNGVPVTVYVDPSVRFGRETVEGLRIARAEESITAAQLATLEQLAQGHDDRINFIRERGDSLTETQARKAIEKWSA
jgi:hypothetical protein